jgi:uncharacterized membrane protein YoaK (UPF0700 family)
MFTDLGISIGHALRGLPLQKRRLLLSVLVISTFCAGATLGTLLFAHLHYMALAVPASAIGVTGLSYALWRQLRG